MRQINPAATPADLPLQSAALARLIEEVAAGETRLTAHGYNRTYNRHNR